MAGERFEKDSISALKLVAEKLNVVAYVSEKDVPLDEIIRLCSKYTIPLYIYKNIHKAIKNKEIEQPDIGLSYQYRRIIKEPLLSFPKNGVINFHSSPVSEQRGVGCCTYAILHGYKEWGVTSHYMDAGIDTGPVIKMKTFDISFLFTIGI